MFYFSLFLFSIYFIASEAASYDTSEEISLKMNFLCNKVLIRSYLRMSLILSKKIYH